MGPTYRSLAYEHPGLLPPPSRDQLRHSHSRLSKGLISEFSERCGRKWKVNAYISERRPHKGSYVECQKPREFDNPLHVKC